MLHLTTPPLQPSAPPPEEWRETTATVFSKCGDSAAECRPICAIPVVDKLHSRPQCNRLRPTLVSRQTPDLASLRVGHSTTDHQYTMFNNYDNALANGNTAFGLQSWTSTQHSVPSKTTLSGKQGVFKTSSLDTSHYHNNLTAAKLPQYSLTWTAAHSLYSVDQLSFLLFDALLQHVMAPLPTMRGAPTLQRTTELLNDDNRSPRTRTTSNADKITTSHNALARHTHAR